MEILVSPIDSSNECGINFCSPICGILDLCGEDGTPIPSCPSFQY